MDSVEEFTVAIVKIFVGESEKLIQCLLQTCECTDDFQCVDQENVSEVNRIKQLRLQSSVVSLSS